jgi:hypothetical protein
MTIAIVLSLAASLSAAPLPEAVRIGDISLAQDDGSSVLVAVYKLAVGDPEPELSRALTRSHLGDFAANAAQYFPNRRGGWKVRNFRLPKNQEEVPDFLAYLRRPDVGAILEDSMTIVDFGEPQGFVYMRTSLASQQLPEPWNKLSAQALAPIQMIQQSNADGTQSVYLAPPFDREGEVQKALAAIHAELGAR